MAALRFKRGHPRSGAIAGVIYRVASCGIAVLGLLISFLVLADYGEQVTLRSLATSALRGESISEEVGAILDPAFEHAECDSSAVDRATLALYLAASGEGQVRSERITRSREAVQTALTCAPHHAILWYGLFWLDWNEANLGEDRANRAISFLKRSYDLGANEGWIGLWRAEDAVRVFDQLDTVTQTKVQREFQSLARTSPAVAARVAVGAESANRPLVLQWISELRPAERDQLARHLDAIGSEIDLPGVTYRDGRLVPEVKRGSRSYEEAPGRR
jgi:hypothetical protein